MSITVVVLSVLPTAGISVRGAVRRWRERGGPVWPTGGAWRLLLQVNDALMRNRKRYVTN